MSSVPPARPRLSGILETVLYYSAGQEDEVERFYSEVLGLRRVGQGFNFRLGDGLLLLFNAEESSRQEEPPPHGASGSVHTCFLAPSGEYQTWKEHLHAHGIGTIQEITWENALRSFFFHDPAGNVLEIAEDDIWPA